MMVVHIFYRAENGFIQLDEYEMNKRNHNIHICRIGAAFY